MKELIFCQEEGFIKSRYDKLVETEKNFLSNTDTEISVLNRLKYEDLFKRNKKAATLPRTQIYINDKGNLVIEQNSMKFYYTESKFKELVEKYKESCKKDIKRIKNDTTIKPYRKIAVYKSFLRNNENAYQRDFRLYHRDIINPDIKEVEHFYVHTERLIIESENKIYYTEGDKIKRIKFLNILKHETPFYRRINELFFNLLNNLADNTSEYWIPFEDVDNILIPKSVTRLQKERMINVVNAYLPTFAKFKENDRRSSAQSYCVLRPEDRTKLFATYLEDSPSFITRKLNKYPDNQTLITTLYNLLFKEIKIKDVNAFNQMYENLCKVEPLSIHSPYADNVTRITKRNLLLVDDLYVSSPHIKTYYKLLKKYYKKSNVNVDMLLAMRLNQLNNKNSNMFTDSLRLLKGCYRNRVNPFYKDKEFAPLDYSILKKKVVDMHEYLSKLAKQDLNVIRYMDYNNLEDALKYECVLGEGINYYKLNVVRNTSELNRLAEVMQNCVAGYSNAIKNKNSIILYMSKYSDILDYIRYGKELDVSNLRKAFQNGFESPLCIEVQTPNNSYWSWMSWDTDENKDMKGEYKLAQCYGYHNSSPNEQAKGYLLKHLTSLGVKVSDRFNVYPYARIPQAPATNPNLYGLEELFGRVVTQAPAVITVEE